MSTNLNDWQQNNQRYLSAALEWVRLRLKRLSQQPAASAAPLSEPAVKHAAGSKWRFWDKPESSVRQPRALLPPAPDGSGVTDDQLAQATEALEAAEAATPAPAMALLSQSFRLSRFEK